jgi:hypothetical protein
LHKYSILCREILGHLDPRGRIVWIEYLGRADQLRAPRHALIKYLHLIHSQPLLAIGGRHGDQTSIRRRTENRIGHELRHRGAVTDIASGIRVETR